MSNVPVPQNNGINLANTALGAFFNQSQQGINAAVSTATSGGIVFPLPRIRAHVKETINGRERLQMALVADDAENADTNLVVSEVFKEPYAYVAPICSMVRHVAWRQQSRVADLPNSTGPCQYCNMPTVSDQDRCENWVELVVAVIDAKPNTPARLRGFYMIPAKSTSYDEIYNFSFYQVLNKMQDGIVPWTQTYMLTFQNITSKKTGYSWNIYRMLRDQDNLGAQVWYREGKNPDGTPEQPAYKSTLTPEDIVKEINVQLENSNSLINKAISLLQLPMNDAASQIRKIIEQRNSTGSAPVVPAKTIGKAVATFAAFAPPAAPAPAATKTKNKPLPVQKVIVEEEDIDLTTPPEMAVDPPSQTVTPPPTSDQLSAFMQGIN